MHRPERRKRIITSAILFLALILPLLTSATACNTGTQPPVPSPAPTTAQSPTTAPAPAPTSTPPAANTTVAVSFSKDVQLILNDHCVVCHQGQGPGQSNLTLEPRLSYSNFVGVPSTENPAVMRVKAGAAGDSYLIAKLTGTQVAAGGSGARMPYQSPPLAQNQIDLISQWISQGALNN